MHDSEGPDADRGENPAGALVPDELRSRSGAGSDTEDTEAPISEADARDEVAQAEARAESARARLARLRRAAEIDDAGNAGDGDEDGSVAQEAVQNTAVSQDVEQRPLKWIRARLRRSGRLTPTPRFRRPGWIRRPSRKAVAAGVGLALAVTSLVATDYMLRQHHTIEHKRQLSQQYSAAARQAVTTLMSIDASHAKDDIQRIIDASTSPLKDQISVMSSLMLRNAEEAKTVTKVNVEAVAVESATENSAVALVVAKSDVIDADNKQRPPQLWRISMELVREGGQFKMSKVDFLQ